MSRKREPDPNRLIVSDTLHLVPKQPWAANSHWRLIQINDPRPSTVIDTFETLKAALEAIQVNRTVWMR